MAITEVYSSPEGSWPSPDVFLRGIDGGSYEPTTSGFLVKPEVMDELAALRTAGVDADTIDVSPQFELDAATQNQVDQQSEALGAMTRSEAFNTLFDPSVHSAGAKWAALSKRAIALWALKQAGSDLPHNIAPDIDPAIYDEPLFGGKSAHQVLRASHPRSADLVEKRYHDITTSLLEDDVYEGTGEDSLYVQFATTKGFSFLSSRDFLTGVVDSRAVDTRAIAATQMALEHVQSNPEMFAGRPLVTASLACGAAAPMFELDQIFEAQGIPIAKNILVDNDPMALASAVALGRRYEVSDKVDAQLEDVVGSKLTDFIEPHSVDVLDILGIVDYLPTKIGGYRAAENFFGKLMDIMRPGGIIVAGNALSSRPHQAFFDKVWPRLQQRNPVEMMDIISRAGYRKGAVQVRIPQREGIYGVYGIKMPTEAHRFKEPRTQRAARQILTVASKFNKY